MSIAGKRKVFITGAAGGMGFESLKQMISDGKDYDLVILARDSEKTTKSARQRPDALLQTGARPCYAFSVSRD